MANTRINPLHDLNKTADDLALLIVRGGYEILMECLLQAKEIYRGPLESWLTFIPYRLMNSRTRFPRLDQTITQILHGYDETNSAKMIDIFSEGGWEETSYNTTLIRVLVKHLHGYDQGIALPLQKVIELKVLLVFAQARLLNQDKILKQQAAITSLKAKENEMRSDLAELTRLLREYDARRAEIQKDEQITDARLQQLTGMCQQQEQALQEYQEQIKKLDAEKRKQEELLEKDKLLILDEKLDVRQLTLEQMEEAKKIAATSINMYMKDIENQGREKAELQTVTIGAVGKASSSLAQHSLFKIDTIARQAELRAISSPGVVDDGFKQRLATLLGSRAVPAKKPADARKEQLSELYKTGQVVKGAADLATVAVVDDYKVEEPVSFEAARSKMATLFMPRAPKPVSAAEVTQSDRLSV